MASKWKNPSGTRTYYIWRSMRSRCLDPNSTSYRFYGAKNILVCQRWVDSYDSFFEDMGECPKDKTLDRINSAGNYEPSNCRWATMKEQQNNRRDNVFITYEDKTLSVSCWADELGIKKSTLFRRLFVQKLPVQLAFTLPLRNNKPKKRKKSERILKKETHGTMSYYRAHKCQCELCLEIKKRMYEGSYEKQKVRAAKKKLTKDYNHGTRYGYDMGCRCYLCTLINKARSETQRKRKKLKKLKPFLA